MKTYTEDALERLAEVREARRNRQIAERAARKARRAIAPYDSRSVATALRNVEIYRDRLAGAEFAKLALRYGITPARVREIFKKQERMARHPSRRCETDAAAIAIKAHDAIFKCETWQAAVDAKVLGGLPLTPAEIEHKQTIEEALVKLRTM